MIFLARTTTKEVHINFPKKEYLQFFIEVLSSSLKHVEFILSYKHNGFKVKLLGERESVLESVGTVKIIGKMIVRSVTPNSQGFYAHHLQLIQQIGSRIISLDSLSSVLRHSGVPSSVVKQELITKAKMEEIQDILAYLYDLIQEIPLNIRTQIMKKVLLSVSYCTNLSPEVVIERALELDYFQKTSNSVTISSEPEQLIEELIEKLSAEEIQSKEH